MRRIHWLVLGVALTAALSATAIAMAKGIKISERSDDFTVAPLGEGEADCAGKRAVAGGFFGEFVPGGGGATVLPFVSTRESESEWRFRAGDVGGGPSDATAYAYCAKNKKFPKLRESSEDETASAGSVTTITADCDGNRRVVAGGFEIPDSFTLVTRSSRNGNRSWTVEVLPTAGGPYEVEAFAYCAKNVRLKQRSSEDTTLSSGELETEEARCKQNQRVVSGGFATDANPATSKIALATASRRDGKRGWEATAYAAASNPVDLTTYAYCLKQPKGS